MLLPYREIISWLIEYKYFIIFPAAIIEGPIITIITGFLGSMHDLSLPLAYIIIVVGDLTGDSIYFALGRFGRKPFINKYGRYIGIDLDKAQKLEKLFKKHPNRAFIAGKLMHGVGPIILFAAGIVRVPFKTLVLLNTIPTMIKSLILLLIGYYFGQFYTKFDIYLNDYSLILLILFVTIYIVLVKSDLFNRLLDDV